MFVPSNDSNTTYNTICLRVLKKVYHVYSLTKEGRPETKIVILKV